MNALRISTRAPRRLLVTSLLVLPLLTAAIIAGCGDDDTTSPPVTTIDSGSDGNTAKDVNVADNFVPGDTGSPDDSGSSDAGADANDAGDSGMTLEQKQKRGQYLVEAVVGCSDCHTPRGAGGAPDMTKFLSGVDCFIATSGTDAGCLNSSNLTNDATGLKNRSDEEIKTMFMDGKRPNGSFLANVMPYYTLHNLRADDADAIVAYLRTVPAVAHTAAANQPPFANIPAASPSFDQVKLPPTGDAGAGQGANLDNGRYLAQFACLECHTKHLPPGSATVLDMTKLFAGNESFPAAALGLPSPPFPDTIYSANITPHATGLQGWKTSDIQKAMQKGLDRSDGGICPPMPAGPMAAFGKLTEQDALDIASYVKGLPAVENTIDGGSGSCVTPPAPGACARPTRNA